MHMNSEPERFTPSNLRMLPCPSTTWFFTTRTTTWLELPALAPTKGHAARMAAATNAAVRVAARHE
jgi:hypothetical protein